MGQKANSNSLRLPSVSKPIFNTVFSPIESSEVLKERLSISSNLSFFFEKKNFLIKENIFQIHKEKTSLSIFFSVFEIKTRSLSKHDKSFPSQKPSFFLVKKIFSTFSIFGYFSTKRLILRNLNKISTNYQKTVLKEDAIKVRKLLKIYKKEKFFEPAISLFCLLNTLKENSSLFSKFVAFFWKMFHKNKRKTNKFKFFLTKFVDLINANKKTLKGLKFQIKGRFNRSERSKTLLFEKGNLPTQAFKMPLEYSLTHLSTSFGVFGIHVWVFDEKC
jgi:hypothetical protein